MMVVYEAAGLNSEFATYLMRSLLSEGRIKYETVMKVGDRLQAVTIEREGPTGLIVTTTKVRLDEELETRLLSVAVTDTPAQTRAILDGMADEAERDPVDMTPWHALQTWLEAQDNRVTIPFSRALVSLVPPLAIRLRRDIGQVLNLIRVHAVLHQATRQRDGEGRIVATLADYAVARELIADLISGSVQATVPDKIRETVKAVEELVEEAKKRDAYAIHTVTITEVARRLGLDKSSVSRRVTEAISLGFLQNDETRPGRAAKLSLGEAMPGDGPAVLPTVDALQAAYADPEPLFRDAPGIPQLVEAIASAD
jgi:hypothetical protein